MSIEQKFIVFQLIIIVPFFFGAYFRSRLQDVDRLAKRLININLIALSPCLVLWSIWGLNLSWIQTFLPISAIVLVTSGFVFGKMSLKFLKLNPKSGTTFCVSSALSNHGITLGGFICYQFGGIDALGLSFMFTLYHVPFIFLFIFPLAGRVSNKFDRTIKDLVSNIFNLRNMPLFALFFALLLKGFGLEKPEIFVPIDELMFISIAIAYFTLGINFEFKYVKAIKHENIILAFLKFLLIPILTYIVLQMIDLGHAIESVILIESFMPTAVFSVITAILFDLDKKLASGLFVINSLLFLILILPVLFLLKGIIFF
jgi:malate permease and related proteins